MSDEPMPVKDQINFYIQNGMSFMLHGPSGVGKSQRVKEIDPDLTSITLCNGILPEDVIGKTIYPNGVGADGASGGVWVPPKWYTDLCRKCETEPDKQQSITWRWKNQLLRALANCQTMLWLFWPVTARKNLEPLIICQHRYSDVLATFTWI